MGVSWTLNLLTYTNSMRREKRWVSWNVRGVSSSWHSTGTVLKIPVYVTVSMTLPLRLALGFHSYCLSLNDVCFYRSSLQVPTQQPIICCLSHCKNFFRMLVVTSLNCSYWWVLFNPLHETMHAYLKCSATVHTYWFSLSCRWDPLLTLIILT